MLRNWWFQILSIVPKPRRRRRSVFSASSLSTRVVAVLSALTLFSFAGSSEAQGIPERVSQLEAQVAALMAQVAALEQEISNLPAAGPMDVQVNCNNGERIQNVLAVAGHRSANVTINVAGFCPEDVYVSRSNTTLRAVAPGDGFQMLSLDGAQRVRVEGLTLHLLDTGNGASFTADGISVIDGRIYVTSGSTGTLSSCTVRECVGGTCVEVNGDASLMINQGVIEGDGTGWGVVTHGSSISLSDTIIRGHSRGIWVAGGTVRMYRGTVEQNTSEAVAMNGGFLVTEGTTFRNNFWMGLAVMGGTMNIAGGEVSGNGTGVFSNGGYVGLGGGVTVRDNRFDGIALENGSSLSIGDATIANNQGHGISLGDVSVAIGNASVTGNQGWGIHCAPSPAVAQFYGLNASGNAAGDIFCPQMQ